MATAPGQPASDVQPGDIVLLRKPHACGGANWEVYRIGADIGLKCLTCGRTVLMPRHEFRVKLRRMVRRASEQP
jgi:hypothetical protein